LNIFLSWITDIFVLKKNCLEGNASLPRINIGIVARVIVGIQRFLAMPRKDMVDYHIRMPDLFNMSFPHCYFFNCAGFNFSMRALSSFPTRNLTPFRSGIITCCVG